MNNVIRQNEITLPLPPGWQDASQLIALAPPRGAFRPNLIVNRQPVTAGETAQKFAASQLPSLKQSLRNYVVVKEGPAKLGPHSGFLREHIFTSEHGRLGQFQFYVVVKNLVYTFAYTDLPEELSAARNTAEKIFGTVKIGP